MIRRQHDQRALRQSGGVQFLQQILHGKIQLHLTGDISLCFFRVGEACYLVFIFYAHGISGKVVLHMAADAHIVGHKGL